MRRPRSSLLAAVVLGSFVAAPAAGLGQGAGCGDAVFYHGTYYSNPVKLAKPLTPGRTIATTFGPHCVNAGQPDSVRAIAGISPRLALLRAGAPRHVHLAPGHFPATRGHPLHARLYPRGGPKATCRTGKVVTWRYAIGGSPDGRGASVGFRTSGGGFIGADVYAGTKIASAVTVAGEPYVVDQYRATAVVRKCQGGRPLVLKLTARPPS